MISTTQIPRATYRLQLSRGFTFNQAAEIVPHLSSLGISHCYISPCLKARPGSMHGYDIVDHNQLNPEIGTPEEFDRFVNRLHEHNMRLVLDIVPNHMAVMGSDTLWWLDVLENGEASAFASFFDIDWQPLKDELRGKVLVPVLHDHYGAVLESGALKLTFQDERGGFDISYRDHRFPVNPREYPRILQRAVVKLTAALGEQHTDLLEFQSLITGFGHLPARQEASGDRMIERNRDKEINKRRLAELCARAPELSSAINEAVESINGTAGDPASFDELHELIKVQAYRLANWRVASDDINYRRFFDTNDLAGLCTENEGVFDATHRLILNFIAEGKVDGLRIDHPDGLYNPAEYFERLQRRIAAAVSQSTSGTTQSRYVVIEKILTGEERLPSEWPVCGTTGYDFSNLVNGLFVDPAGATRFERIYRNFIGDEIDFDDLAYRCRKLIIQVALDSELNVLAHKLTRIALSKRNTCDFTLNSLREALTDVVASFPVYRTYVGRDGISGVDKGYICEAVDSAKFRSPANDTSIFDFIREVLLTRIADGHDASYRNAVTGFTMKFQQFTSPVMAKGLEDTAFYRYNRLISLNDVGGDLQRFGTLTEEFHLANQERFRSWPHTMLATSTHDSKRSEDVRARINVLSEIPALWKLRVQEWKRLNRRYKSVADGKPAPSPNDEYLLYQTLVGAWPSLPDRDDARENGEWKGFSERIESYMLKAIREAKQNTSWINRNEAYENAVSSFVKALLSPGQGNRFLDNFVPFQRRVARLGLWNSLSQTLLKLTCPGVPDIYQGNEVWDFSLVDPDNRRPVDYARRQEIFKSIRGWGNAPSGEALGKLLQSPEDGRPKMYLIKTTLRLRAEQPDIFQRGDYLSVEVKGAKAGHGVAFIRSFENAKVLVIVPRLVAGLLGERELPPIGPEVWEDTHILLPSSGDRQYRNAFTGEDLAVAQEDSYARIDLANALAQFPVAIFHIGLSQSGEKVSNN
jgi:(1->4)-alpha-D-glucan 1-alpha-D-glucosylmutase